METPPKWTIYLFLTGIVIFSGSLYALCLTGVTKLGAITPVGGLALMSGWLTLCWPQKNGEKHLHGP